MRLKQNIDKILAKKEDVSNPLCKTSNGPGQLVLNPINLRQSSFIKVISQEINTTKKIKIIFSHPLLKYSGRINALEGIILESIIELGYPIFVWPHIKPGQEILNLKTLDDAFEIMEIQSQYQIQEQIDSQGKRCSDYLIFDTHGYYQFLSCLERENTLDYGAKQQRLKKILNQRLPGVLDLATQAFSSNDVDRLLNDKGTIESLDHLIINQSIPSTHIEKLLSNGSFKTFEYQIQEDNESNLLIALECLKEKSLAIETFRLTITSLNFLSLFDFKEFFNNLLPQQIKNVWINGHSNLVWNKGYTPDKDISLTLSPALYKSYRKANQQYASDSNVQCDPDKWLELKKDGDIRLDSLPKNIKKIKLEKYKISQDTFFFFPETLTHLTLHNCTFEKGFDLSRLNSIKSLRFIFEIEKDNGFPIDFTQLPKNIEELSLLIENEEFNKPQLSINFALYPKLKKLTLKDLSLDPSVSISELEHLTLLHVKLKPEQIRCTQSLKFLSLAAIEAGDRLDFSKYSALKRVFIDDGEEPFEQWEEGDLGPRPTLIVLPAGLEVLKRDTMNSQIDCSLCTRLSFLRLYETVYLNDLITSNQQIQSLSLEEVESTSILDLENHTQLEYLEYISPHKINLSRSLKSYSQNSITSRNYDFSNAFRLRELFIEDHEASAHEKFQLVPSIEFPSNLEELHLHSRYTCSIETQSVLPVLKWLDTNDAFYNNYFSENIKIKKTLLNLALKCDRHKQSETIHQDDCFNLSVGDFPKLKTLLISTINLTMNSHIKIHSCLNLSKSTILGRHGGELVSCQVTHCPELEKIHNYNHSAIESNRPCFPTANNTEQWNDENEYTSLSNLHTVSTIKIDNHTTARDSEMVLSGSIQATIEGIPARYHRKDISEGYFDRSGAFSLWNATNQYNFIEKTELLLPLAQENLHIPEPETYRAKLTAHQLSPTNWNVYLPLADLGPCEITAVFCNHPQAIERLYWHPAYQKMYVKFSPEAENHPKIIIHYYFKNAIQATVIPPDYSPTLCRYHFIFSTHDYQPIHFLGVNISKSEKITQLVQFFKKFKDSALTPNNASTDANHTLLQIIKEQKGVCRHRAHAFMFLAKLFSLPARYVSNDRHAFVECYEENNRQWVPYDLGGGTPASIRYEPPKLSEKESQPTPFSKNPGLVLAFIITCSVYRIPIEWHLTKKGEYRFILKNEPFQLTRQFLKHDKLSPYFNGPAAHPPHSHLLLACAFMMFASYYQLPARVCFTSSDISTDIQPTRNRWARVNLGQVFDSNSPPTDKDIKNMMALLDNKQSPLIFGISFLLVCLNKTVHLNFNQYHKSFANHSARPLSTTPKEIEALIHLFAKKAGIPDADYVDDYFVFIDEPAKKHPHEANHTIWLRALAYVLLSDAPDSENIEFTYSTTTPSKDSQIIAAYSEALDNLIKKTSQQTAQDAARNQCLSLYNQWLKTRSLKPSDLQSYLNADTPQRHLLIQHALKIKPESIQHAIYLSCTHQNRQFLYIGHENASIYHDQIDAYFKPLVIVKRTITPSEGPIETILREGGVLVINWGAFSAEESAKFMSLLDTHSPNFLGLDASRVTVIGLMNEQANSCAAFQSRCTVVEWDEKATWIDKPATPTAAPKEKALEVNLYLQPGWQTKLLGSIAIKRGVVTYTQEEAPLFQAMAENRPLKLYNLPDDPALLYFIERLNQDRYFFANGKHYNLPDHTFLINGGLQQEDSLSNVRFTDQLPNVKDQTYRVFILNNQTYSNFQEQIQVSNDIPTRIHGWLHDYQPNDVICLTEGLTKHVQSFINQCFKARPQKLFTLYQGGLQSLIRDKTIHVSNDLDFHVLQIKKNHPGQSVKTINVNLKTTYEELIESQCIETANGLKLRQMSTELVDSLVNGETLLLNGDLSIEVFQKLLPLIVNECSLWINGQILEYSGQIILNLPHTTKLLPLLSFASVTSYKPNDYFKELGVENSDFSQSIQTFYQHLQRWPHTSGYYPEKPRINYAKTKNLLHALQSDTYKLLKTIFPLDYRLASDSTAYAYLSVVLKGLWSRYHSDKVLAGWNERKYQRIQLMGGWKTLSENTAHHHAWRIIDCANPHQIRKLFQQNLLPSLNAMPKLSEEQWHHLTPILENFRQEHGSILKPLNTRLQEAIICNTPLLFIKGLSGVGKTFMIRSQANSEQWAVYEDIADWLNDSNAFKKKILLLDEANLFPSETWDWIKDRYLNHEDRVYYQGKFHHLSPQHIIIATGNPLDYPNRQDAEVFYDYGKTFYMNEMQQEALEKLALQWCQLNNSQYTGQQAPHQAMVQLWQTLTQQKHTSITLRDLSSLIARWNIYRKELPAGKAFIKSACMEFYHSIFQAEEQKRFIDSLKTIATTYFGKDVEESDLKQMTNETQPLCIDDDLILPSSRMWLQELVQTLLDYREQALQTGTHLHKPGILLQGPSGIGKSLLFEAILKNRMTDEDYIKISAGTHYAKEQLIKAFFNGSLVILDELNLDPSIETLLNQLLSITTYAPTKPVIELARNIAKSYGVETSQEFKPGFTLLASQNPASYAGRHSVSNALRNRMHMLYVPDYSREELIEITQAKKNLSREKIEPWVDAWQIIQGRRPFLNSRNYFRILDKHNFSIEESKKRPRPSEEGLFSRKRARQETNAENINVTSTVLSPE